MLGHGHGFVFWLEVAGTSIFILGAMALGAYIGWMGSLPPAEHEGWRRGGW